MGFMESAVVIYLRKIYYPDGFQFPLVPLDMDIGIVELFREAATIIMLVGIGILAAKAASLRFAYFILCFAIWDLFYYVFLKIFLDWPESLFTWDILFLIPVPWVGPVITPCIISLTMILLAGAIIHFHVRGNNTKLHWKEWSLFIAGSIITIYSFILDYLNYIKANPASGANNEILSDMLHYVPATFNWPVFLTGEAVILSGIVLFILRMKKQKNISNTNTIT
jgi:hypothetical protein